VRRLVLLALTLAVLIACGLTFTVAHADRVDPGGVLVVEITAVATADGAATPGFCAGLPSDWTVEGQVSFTIGAGHGIADLHAPDVTVVALSPQLVWSCWSTPAGSFTSGTSGKATLNLRVPKAASGSYALKWVVDYDITDGVDSTDVQETRVFVGNARRFASAEGARVTDELVATLAAPRDDVVAWQTKAEAWLAGTGKLTSQDLLDAATAWKTLREATDKAQIRSKTLKVAPADKKRAKAAIADARANLTRWTPLWSRVLIAAGGHIQEQLGKVKKADGTYDTISPELDSTMGYWLRAFDTVGSVQKLDPTLDAGLMEILLVARFAEPSVQSQVAEISLRLSQGKKAKALAYFVQASSKFAAEGKDGPDVRASCALAIQNAAGTDIADDMKEACGP
jgi:hypothetical protein